MTISTNLFYSQAAQQMRDLQNNMSRIQTQVSSGQALTKPSDDPTKLNAIVRLTAVLDRQNGYTKTLGLVGDRLKAEETSVRNVSTTLGRIKTLALQATNAATSPADRANLAIEMQTLKGGILSSMAARDVEGNYLFSGTRAGAQPFGNSSDTYTGDKAAMRVQLSDQDSMALNRPGADVFSGITRDGARKSFMTVITDAIDAVSTSNGVNMTRSLSEIDAISQNVSVAITRNGADQNKVTAQQTLVADTTLQLQATLNNLQNTDMTQAITQLQQQVTQLSAAQSSFAKISGLNLFNFLK